MYGDAEDSSSDSESLTEAPQASTRDSWSQPRSHGSSPQEDPTESEEEQIEICSTNGHPHPPSTTPVQAAPCPALARGRPSKVVRHSPPVTLGSPHVVNGLGHDRLHDKNPDRQETKADTTENVYPFSVDVPKNGESVLADLHISESQDLDDLLQKRKMISRRPIMAWFKEINKNSQGSHGQSKPEKDYPAVPARSPDSKIQMLSSNHKKWVAIPNSPPPLKINLENKDSTKKGSVETLLSNCQKPKCGPKLRRLSIKSKSKVGSEAPAANPAKAGGADHRKSFISPQTSHRMLSKGASHRFHIADQEEHDKNTTDTPQAPQCVLESRPPPAASGSLKASASDTSISTFISPLTSPKTLPEQGAYNRFHAAVHSESNRGCPATPRSPRCGPEGKAPCAVSGLVSPAASRSSVSLAGVRQSEPRTSSQMVQVSDAAQPRGTSEKGSKRIASDPLERTNQLKIVEISSERMPKNACGDKPAESDRQGGFLAQGNCQEKSKIRFHQSVESSPNHPSSLVPPAPQVEQEMQRSFSVAKLASSSSPQLPAKKADPSQGRSSLMSDPLGMPKNDIPMAPAGEDHPYFTPRPATRTYSMPAQFSSHFGRESHSPHSPGRSPRNGQVPVTSTGLPEAKASKGSILSLANGQAVCSVKPLQETSKNVPTIEEGDITAVQETSCLVTDKIKVTRRHYYYEQNWPHESTSFFSVKQRIKSFENLANSDRPTTKSGASPFLSVSSKPPIGRRSSGSITSGSLGYPSDAAARSLRRSLSSCSESQSESGALLPQMTKSPSSMTLIVSRQNAPETRNKVPDSDQKKSLVPLGIPTPTVTPASPIKKNKSSVRHAQPSPVSRSKLQELRALSMPDLDKLCSSEDYPTGPSAMLFKTQLEIIPRRSLGSPSGSPTAGLPGLDGPATLSCPGKGGNRACPGRSSPTASEPAAPSSANEVGKTTQDLPLGKSWSVNLDQLEVSVGDQQRLQAVLSSVGSKSSTLTLIQEAKAQSENKEDICFIVLNKKEGSGLGFSVAGGTDVEPKSIMVHRVFSQGAASQEGTVNRGDFLLSINGTSLTGLAHGDVLKVLHQAQLHRHVLMVIKKGNEQPRSSSRQEPPMANGKGSLSRKTMSLEPGTGRSGVAPGALCVEVLKTSAGLGLSLDGGKSSMSGDGPLVIKRVYKGGAAEQAGTIEAGDEILAINGKPLVGLMHFDAWNIMKSVPEGPVQLVIRKHRNS
uniref:PDZ domain-containing protein n=1 Tax=Spermophilus dauricus TaxID=99837 RepID=A0A8C9P0M7_SPEDA